MIANTIGTVQKTSLEPQKLLTKHDKEEWFIRNLRTHDNKSAVVHKDKLKGNTNLMTKVQIAANAADSAGDIDPIFCKAYGVQYNSVRAGGVYFSDAKAVEIDEDFTEFLSIRAPTPVQKTKEEEEAENIPEYIKRKLE